MSKSKLWSRFRKLGQKLSAAKDAKDSTVPQPQGGQQQHDGHSSHAASTAAQPESRSHMRRQSTQASQDSLSPSGCAEPQHRFFSCATCTASTNIPDRALGPTACNTPSMMRHSNAGPSRLSDSDMLISSVYVNCTGITKAAMAGGPEKSRLSQSEEVTTPDHVSGAQAVQQPQQTAERQQGLQKAVQKAQAAAHQQHQQQQEAGSLSTKHLLNAVGSKLAYIYNWLDQQPGVGSEAVAAANVATMTSAVHPQQASKQQGAHAVHRQLDKLRISDSSADGGSPRIATALQETCNATVGSSLPAKHKWRSPTSSTNRDSSSGSDDDDDVSGSWACSSSTHSSAGKTPFRPKRAKQQHQQQPAGKHAAPAAHPADGFGVTALSQQPVAGRADSCTVDCVVDLVGLSSMLPKPKWQPAAAAGTAARPAESGAPAPDSPQAAPRRSQTVGDSVKREGGKQGTAQASAAADWAAAASRFEAVRRGSKMIAVARHCPEDMLCDQWCIDDFELRSKVYEGHLSCVVKALHKPSRRMVAIKIYKRSRLHAMERQQLAREICLHVRTMHPHVISLYAAWKDSQHVYLALECARDGNLLEKLLSYKEGYAPEEAIAKKVAKPLLMALAHMHGQGVIHRDVKLENILLDDDTGLKLADLGLSIDAKAERANTRLGTFGYMSPELLDCPLKSSPSEHKAQPGAGQRTADTPPCDNKTGDPGCCPGGVCAPSGCLVADYDSKVDVWSAGVVLYEMLTGRAPFSASTPHRILEAIRRRPVIYPAHLSPEAASLLASMLTRDPTYRPTCRELLSHPWILKHCPRRGAPPATAAATTAASTADGAAAQAALAAA